MDMNTAPETQKVMGWRIAAALFLVGTGAGAYLIGFIFNVIFPGFTAMSKVAVVLAAPVVLVGGLLLLCDIGRRRAFYRAFARPKSSWMAIGAILLTVFIILDLIHIFTWVWPSTGLGGAAYLTLGIIASIFAVLCLVYTGLLLGVVKSVALWSGAFLPVLFLISGLSMGTMAAVFVLSLSNLAVGSAEIQTLVILARFNFFVIIIESMVIGLYLGSMQAFGAARNPAMVLTRGRLAGAFWGGVVAAALVIPFILEALKAYATIGPVAMLVLAVVSSVIGLVGGFMLRYVVVYGGTRTLLNIQGVLVSPPPDEYKVKIIERATYSTLQKRHF